MGETPESLLKLVNASGFLFQLRVAQEIENTFRTHHGWTTIGQEHRWVDAQSGDEGFIDLLITNDRETIRMVIECKRVGEGTTWVFLVPNAAGMQTRRARLLWTYAVSGRSMSDWDDLALVPEFQESAFCVARGQTDKTQPMLERISDTVLKSVECLAQEGHRMDLGLTDEDNGSDGPRLATYYVPAVVTTAALQICRFDPNDIALLDGRIPDGSAQFETVPYVRFRKSLTTKVPPQRRPRNLRAANLASERTVLVIQAGQLINLLKQCKIGRLGPVFPWQAYLADPSVL